MWRFVLSASLLVVVALAAPAQVPDSLSFQGCLTDASGNPISDGTRNVTFRLHTHPTAEALVWQEFKTLTTKDCVFNTYLGSASPLKAIAFDRPYWLEFYFDGSDIEPRTPFASAPYAFGMRGLRTIPFVAGTPPKGGHVIGGSMANVVAANSTGGTIGGGGYSNTPGIAALPNEVTGDLGTIGGGSENMAGKWATVGGGSKNEATMQWATVAGGEDNSAAGENSFVGGGTKNVASGLNSGVGSGLSNSATNSAATVAGGDNNQATGDYAFVGGGELNVASSRHAVVGGGQNNAATKSDATVAGGILNQATGQASVVSGGQGNIASGGWSTVPGGTFNEARAWGSFAAGHQAIADVGHDGTFVWGDSQTLPFTSTGKNQFLIRASGGVGIGLPSPFAPLHIKEQENLMGESGIVLEYWANSNYWATDIDEAFDYNFRYNGELKAYILDSNGSYVSVSDERLKTDVTPIDPVLDRVTALRPVTYRFLDESSDAAPSVGFLAQDVEPLFPELVVEKDGIKGLTFAQFAVIAIKAIQEQQRIIEELRARLDRIER